MPKSHAQVIADELSLEVGQVERTLALLADGATLPFIARYRKEVTGNLDEVQIGALAERAAYLAELDARKQTVLGEIDKQGKLTPELKARITHTLSKTELEDLYLPYKPKRRTRATIARERGLEPLALAILAQEEQAPPRDELAAPYVDPAREVPDTEAAFAGARDIVAELVSERADVRAALRNQALADGVLASTVVPGKEEEGQKFKDYFNNHEAVREIPSHRLLALRRGEKEGFLRVALEVDRQTALDRIERLVVERPRAALADELKRALTDAYDRLLQPSIEVDARLALKERADGQAIQVFAANLRNLLLQSPLGTRRVLAVDPGYRTGCKVVVLDDRGGLCADTVIYPTQSDKKLAEAEAEVARLCAAHRPEAVAIGNGTAGRETEGFFRRLQKDGRLGDAKVVLVNEAGASVYSASEIAREELPDKDVTVRGAVSIGRRLQDPLAELVKIDPKSIGVGQYQHDVHQPTLKKALDTVVESCVNHVGVDLNTASVKLLQYVAGVGESLARNIVTFRAEKGAFKARKELLEVPRFGQKAFEQAAGFLRIAAAAHPLDNSAVHPERYALVEKMAADLGVPLAQLVGNAALVRKIDLVRYASDECGLPTLKDIAAELEKPGRDPRTQFEEVGFNPDVTEFEHVKEGMVLAGVVTNVTQFGAFVDVGVHQDGLVHVSELANRFVKDPGEVVKVGDRVKVKVIKVDAARRRLGLSMKQLEAPEARPAPHPQKDGAGPKKGERGGGPRPPAPPREKEKRPFNNPFAAAFGNLTPKK
jgi:uncharacterized protein